MSHCISFENGACQRRRTRSVWHSYAPNRPLCHPPDAPGHLRNGAFTPFVFTSVFYTPTLATCAGFADVWSFSAVLGGYLLDKYGFRVNFALTALFQTVAWSLLLLLLPVVPAREGVAVTQPAGEAQPVAQRAVAAAAVVAANEPELAEPLLAAES